MGTLGSFTVTTGPSFPANAALSETGTLPSGVTFVDNGDGTATLSGTPAAGSGGIYTFTITATNGVAPDATQTFTLTDNEAPAITGANNTTFVVGMAGSFTVTTSGFPAPSLSETGPLPSGVTFVDNGDGTATLSGTPAAGSGGIYTFVITASNGVAARGHSDLHADGRRGADDHQRQQHDVRSGHTRQLHRHHRPQFPGQCGAQRDGALCPAA